MNSTDIKAIIQQFEHALNTRNKEQVIGMVDKSAVFYTPAVPEPLYGGEGYYQLVDYICSGFSDAKWHIQEMIAENHHVAVHWQLTGTHDGVFLGQAPTHKTICVGLMNFYYFNQDGLIEKDIAAEGMIGILRGIGLLP